MSSSSEASRSHTLIVILCLEPLAPDNPRYFQSDAVRRTLAGAVVYKGLLRRFGLEFYDEVSRMASVFGRVGPAASWLWEGWCHRHNQTHLDLLPMVVNGENLVLSDEPPERIQMGRLAHRLYSSKNTLRFTADPGKYYIPSESNNATFDAFFRCEGEQKGICLQMTIRTGHSLALRRSKSDWRWPWRATLSLSLPRARGSHVGYRQANGGPRLNSLSLRWRMVSITGHHWTCED